MAQEAQSPAERQRAAEHLLLAEAAATRAAAAQQAATAKPEPTHIRGDYGSTAYVRKVWTFEVIELDAVPRDYMSLDVDVVREAINKDARSRHPGAADLSERDPACAGGRVTWPTGRAR